MHLNPTQHASTTSSRQGCMSAAIRLRQFTYPTAPSSDPQPATPATDSQQPSVAPGSLLRTMDKCYDLYAVGRLHATSASAFNRLLPQVVLRSKCLPPALNRHRMTTHCPTLCSTQLSTRVPDLPLQLVGCRSRNKVTLRERGVDEQQPRLDYPHWTAHPYGVRETTHRSYVHTQ